MRRATIALAIAALLLAVGVVALAGQRAMGLYDAGVRAARADAAARRLSTASGELLAAREPIDRLALAWLEARGAFATELSGLEGVVAGAGFERSFAVRLRRVRSAWSRIDGGLSGESLLAGRDPRVVELVGAAGLQLAFERLLKDPNAAGADVARLQSLQTRLEELARRIVELEGELDAFAVDAGRTARTQAALAGVAALVLLIAAAAATCVLLLRVARLNAGLATATDRQRALLAAVPDLILVLDRDGVFREVHGDLALLALEPRMFLGRRQAEVLDQQLAQRADAAFSRALALGVVETIDYRMEVAGRERDFTGRYSPAGGHEVLLAITDVTERRSFEDRLRHGERLEAMGRLAGGVAHDFNNLLTGILGYADLLRRGAGEDRRRSRQAEAIVSAATRAAELTAQLLAFSRSGVRSTRDLDLHEVVRAALDLLRRTIDSRIAIEEELVADRRTVTGDPGRLQSALLNLAVNARDAMPDGGVLRVSTADALAPGPGAPAELAPGTYCRVEVRDSGTGMDERVRARLFEPFFTTKAPGKGTGLGLAAVHGTVSELGGAVTVASEPGEGATFTLWIPVSDREPGSLTPPARTAIGGSGRILVAEDEPALRELAAEVLGGLGYEVRTAADGVEALELLRAGPADLVLLDLVMPRMGGAACAEALRAVDPQVRLLAMSGFAEGADVERMRIFGAEVLRKPWRAEQLAAAVSAAMR